MSNKKNVEIISVGTELLLGNIVNTNAAYLAQECAKIGLACFYQTVVGDNEERLKEALSIALNRSDAVILSGGLGPTEDDLTKQVCAEFAGVKLIEDEEAKKNLISFFEKRGTPMPDNNFRQILVPENGIVLKNDNGLSPGCVISFNEKHMILLPGVPTEMKPMFEDYAIPFLRTLSDEVFVSQTVKLVSVAESVAEEKIIDLIDSQTNPTIATYAKQGEVHVRVTASGKDEADCEKKIKPLVRELIRRFGDCVYTTKEDISLEKAVVDLLLSGGLKVRTVESCTGGMVASRIVNVPGASEVFKAGLVTYSNKAKRKFAGVKKATIEKFTAVSKETAAEMVKGTDLGPKADVLVGVTGYADGGDDHPAGLVYIACNVCGETTVKEFRFNGNRNKVRESATTQALVLMRECILRYLSAKALE